MKDVGAFKRPSPVLLSSGCTVVPGSTAQPSMDELSYPFRKAVLIDEVRFDLHASGSNTYGNLGCNVYTKLQLGQHYLMRDWVPIWLLGTNMSVAEEELGDTNLNTEASYSHYRWRFPEPLFVEPGQVLWANFNSVVDSLSPNANIAVQVSYAGRVVPPRATCPKSIIVPYAAPFVTTIGNTYQQSNEYNLFNPFGRPMRVQRLTGRVRQNNNWAYSNEVSSTQTTLSNAPNIQIFDSWGNKMVNDRIGVGDVFDTFRAAWTVDVELPEKGQYDVRVWNINAATQQIHIGMIGSREERL